MQCFSPIRKCALKRRSEFTFIQPHVKGKQIINKLVSLFIQVEAEAVVIEADDVPEAISLEIAKFSISTLVIGASSRSLLAR